MRNKIPLPLHQRLFIYAITLFGIYMLCFVVFQFRREKEYKIDMLNYRLQVVNTHVGDAIKDRENIDLVVAELSTNEFEQLRITVIDTLGKVVYDSYPHEDFSFNDHSNRPEVIKARITGMGHTVRRLSESTNQEYFYSATMLNGVIVRSALPYTVSLRGVLRADRSFLRLMLGMALIISFLGYVATRRLGRNIEKLRKFALEAARGDTTNDIGEFPNDELGEISSQVVHLYTELKETKDRLEGEHQLIMTHEHEKAQLKKQLTQNINHELKTPVSSIKGYLEILKDNPSLDETKRNDFIDKSFAQVERLTHLLSDISTITRMDEASELITKTELDLSEIIKDVLTEAQPTIEQAGVIVNCRFGSGLKIVGNQSSLHSIFANLTDNALAYSGCSMIDIKVTENEEYYKICVADNGNGIGSDHLERIFDRFYRVDKGRSRKVGGTGLGLSIVKNAVILHSGAISAQERNGGGTAFVFTLKKD